MRKPTPYADLYRWWRESVEGRSPERVNDDEPQCGYYRRQFVRGGPWVPIEIVCDRELDDDGMLAGPERIIAILPGDVRQVAEAHWLSCEPITEADFYDLVDTHKRDDRMRATHAPIDLSEKPVRL